MSTQLLYFDVSCPKCGKAKEIKVPNSLFINKAFGTVKIKIPQGAVCEEHNFIVFITTKGKIVGYDLIDASISTESSQNTIKEENVFSLEKLIIELGFNCVAGLIHAKLFDYPSFIIRNEDLQIDLENVNLFLDGVIPDKYKNNNAIKDIEFDSYVFPNEDYFYTMVKLKEKNAFLINNHRLVIQVPWDINLEFEKSVLSSAMERINKADQLKYLTHYISQFINDIDFTNALLESMGSISKKELMKRLKEKLIISTINKDRINLIKNFLERRVSPEISSKIK